MAYGYNANQMNLPQAQVNPTNPQINSQMLNQNIQPLFPQPQGNVYNINSTLEVANVPVGAGMSIALCLPENVMYIKTMQNGNPLFYPYKIVPFTNQPENETSTNNASQAEQSNISVNQLAEQIKNCNERIGTIEEQIVNFSKMTRKGSDFDL